MSRDLHDVANEINALFRRYGLDHDVVKVVEATGIYLDPRENEPDPRKWTARPTGQVKQTLIFIDADDVAKMDILLTSLNYVFDVFFEQVPPTGQMRLF